jgi:hypothetical protein
MELTFVKEKETKNTWRYQETQEAGPVGALYIRKDAVRALNNPEKIIVTIKEAK